MSLAEPRKRRKNQTRSINLSAPNHWTNDDSKFGQRMLEKFGWSKGSGLGKNKQGISENIKVQHKVTPTGLGFVAHNADDWFKAGEDYTRLLSQLTEKFDQYQSLSNSNDEKTIKKKSLVQNSLDSRSRVHYHKFTKGKDLTQYKEDELACILGKGIKDDQGSKGLDMKEYFKTKRENKTIKIDKSDTSNNEDTPIINLEETNEKISATLHSETNIDEHEIKIIPLKKKKCESKLTTKIDELNNVEVIKKKKKSKDLIIENVDDVEKSKSKKIKKLKSENVENVSKSVNSESNSNHNINTVKEPHSELVLTHKYQHLVDLLIENSSAGKKFYKDLPDTLFDNRMKEFEDNVKHQYAITICSPDIKSTDEESISCKSTSLNPDDKNFIKDFEAQKSKVLEIIAKRQEVSKYINEKSMFIAKHGDILFFGSNINDIKGYGDW